MPTKEDLIFRLRKIQRDLPNFTSTFFIAMENNSTILTRLNYAYDLRVFFNFLIKEIPYFAGKKVIEITALDLKQIDIDNLYQFLDYLNLYYNNNNNNEKTNPEKYIENTERGKARKIACLRSFFKHYYKKKVLDKNICELLDTPKIHEKPITRLTSTEVQMLINSVESGSNLTDKQKDYHKKNMLRDLAILTFFLTTGIRVSELVSINIADVDFSANSFLVTRKGGNRVILYFDTETNTALNNYLEERKNRGSYALTSPLFTTTEQNRISVRAVQNMVKKYTTTVTPLKKITPHKLRSTYGTMLYDETSDIYLVADVLGHKDVNTTKKHYAAMSEENRKRASKVIKLRD